MKIFPLFSVVCFDTTIEEYPIFLSLRNWESNRGNSHIEQMGMLVGNFEFKPLKEDIIIECFYLKRKFKRNVRNIWVRDN